MLIYESAGFADTADMDEILNNTSFMSLPFQSFLSISTYVPVLKNNMHNLILICERNKQIPDLIGEFDPFYS